MNTWYSKQLGDGIQAYGPSDEIKKAFLPMHVLAGQPIEMAVFSRYDLHANIVTVYFSPAAKDLAAIFSATPCERPNRGDEESGKLGLLIGSPYCWDSLYPGA